LKLTPTQLMFVKMLVPDPTYDEAEWKKISYRLTLEYQNEIGGLSADELADLVSRDVIIDHNDLGKTLFDMYEINPKYARKFSLKVYPMPRELADSYPTRFKGSDGREYLGANCSAEEIAKDYLRAIGNDPEEHKRVLDDVAWAKEKNAIKVGLKKFVQTRYWRIIREDRTSNNNTVSDVTII